MTMAAAARLPFETCFSSRATANQGDLVSMLKNIQLVIKPTKASNHDKTL
jgi:hypothetical protein